MIDLTTIHADDCPSDDWRRVHEHLTNVVQKNNNAPFVDDDSRWPCGLLEGEHLTNVVQNNNALAFASVHSRNKQPMPVFNLPRPQRQDVPLSGPSSSPGP